MELLLIRHGEAEPPQAAADDEKRELTEDGRQDVRSMAEVLLRAELRPEAIFTSPLVRARQTGDVLAQVLGVEARPDDRLRPGATLGGVQAVVNEGRVSRVLLVGHEPDLSTIVRELTGGRVKMRTSGVARVAADRIEPGAGVLLSLLSPDLALGLREDR
jgi:phosphohistidine phosphatase